MDYYYAVDATPGIVDGKPAANVLKRLKNRGRDSLACEAACALDVHLYNGSMAACLVNVKKRRNEPIEYLAYKDKVYGKVHVLNLRKSLRLDTSCSKDKDGPGCQHCIIKVMLAGKPHEYLPSLPCKVEHVVREKLGLLDEVAKA